MSKSYYIVTFKGWAIENEDEKAVWKLRKTLWTYTEKKEAIRFARNLSKYERYKSIHVLKVTANEEIDFLRQ